MHEQGQRAGSSYGCLARQRSLACVKTVEDDSIGRTAGRDRTFRGALTTRARPYGWGIRGEHFIDAGEQQGRGIVLGAAPRSASTKCLIQPTADIRRSQERTSGLRNASQVPVLAGMRLSGTSVEFPRIHRAIDMANQYGDINAFNGGNSKSSKDVRQVPHEARMTRRVGDRL